MNTMDTKYDEDWQLDHCKLDLWLNIFERNRYYVIFAI